MSVEVDATEVYKALREVKANVQRVESPALRKAGEYAQEKLRQNTPYWDGTKSNGKRGSYMQEHAKNHVVTSSVKNGLIEVGYDTLSSSEQSNNVQKVSYKKHKSNSKNK